MQTEYLTDVSARLEAAAPHEVLEWAAETFGERLVVVTSFQPTGIATLHMLSQIISRPIVITLDTGLLFPETYALMDEVEERFHLRLIRVRPELNVDAQATAYGPALWDRDPDACCQIRKVLPLERALTTYDAWVAGVRRDQSQQRSRIPVVGWDRRHDNVKIAPFASWTERMIWTYMEAHDLPYNTLHDRNYPTIGCWPCTRPVPANNADPREGRWPNHAKNECGIHIGGQ